MATVWHILNTQHAARESFITSLGKHVPDDSSMLQTNMVPAA